MNELDNFVRRQEEGMERELAQRLGPRTLGDQFPDVPVGIRSLIGRLAADAVADFRMAGERPLLARVVVPATAQVMTALERLRGRLIRQLMVESRSRLESLARIAVEWTVIAWKHEAGEYLTGELAQAGTAHVLERLTVREVHRAVQRAANKVAETGSATLNHADIHDAVQQAGQRVSRTIQEQLRFDLDGEPVLRRQA